MQTLTKILIVPLIALVLAPSPTRAQTLSFDSFVKQLAEKKRLRDQRGFDKTIKANSTHAIAQYIAYVRASMRDSEDESAAEHLTALEEAWKRVFDESEALERVNRWAQLLDNQDFMQYHKARRGMVSAYGAFAKFKNDAEQSRTKWENLRDSVMRLSEQFEYLGEMLYAAEAWGLVSQIYTKIPNQSLLDRREAVFALERFTAHREAWDHTKDIHYLQNANWVKDEKVRLKDASADDEKRQADGYEAEVKGAEAFLIVDADKVEQVAQLEFKALSKQRAKDFCVRGGAYPLMWEQVTLSEKGPTQLDFFKAVELFMVRPGNNKYGVTTDGLQTDLKKNPFQPVKASNRLKKPAEFYLGPNKTKPYAMWFYTGSQSEPFQGMAQNYEPTWKRAIIFCESAASWTATVAGVPITLFDDNSDGRLFTVDTRDLELKLRTVTLDHNQQTVVPAFDGMRIGKKGADVPFSQWVKVGDGWFHLRGKQEGDAIGIRPTNPEYFKTGKLRLNWGGPKSTKVEVLVVQGVGDFATARFDLSSGKAVEVPAGQYRLQYGRIVTGKGARMLTASIFPGSVALVEVEDGKSTKLELGAPFQMDFVRGGSGRDLELDARNFEVIGCGGETYRHVNGAVPSVEVLTAKDDRGKGKKVIAEFVAITDPELASKLSNDSPIGNFVGFFPVIKGESDWGFELKTFVDQDLLVGLREDKNKLFGKLLPIFK